jgi:hypothetical protein
MSLFQKILVIQMLPVDETIVSRVPLIPAGIQLPHRNISLPNELNILYNSTTHPNGSVKVPF